METKSQMINRIAELSQENAELKGTINAYQMSENEANEIIAELKAKNKIILDRLTQYEEDADVQVCLFSDVKRLEQENAELMKNDFMFILSELESLQEDNQ